MNQSKIEALAKELAKDLKTPEDLSQFSAILKKVTVEAALSAEMDDHLGYEPHSPSGYNTGNSRNGRGRNGRCQPPPAQIRTCATNAYGSYLGCLT